jgi:glycosyltransferase involved in cell wall biosynthesis
VSALVDLLEDCRPADLDRVIPIVQRLHAWLGDAAYAGCDKEAFVGRTLALAQGGRFDADRRLTLAGDALDLSAACALPFADADYGRIGVLVRAALGEAAAHIRHRGETADKRVMRRHTVLPGALVDESHAQTRSLVEYVAALARDPGCELVDVWVHGEVSPELGRYIAERLGPALERVRLFAIDRQPDYLALLMQQGPRTTHVWFENPLSADISLLALIGPTLMVTGEDVPPLQHADVYWSCREPAYLEALWRRRGAPEAFVANYVQTQAVPHHVAPAVRTRSREELGLASDDLVIATAGDRLGAEFDQAFVDGMGGFLLADPRRRWLVAGDLPDFWMSAFQQVLGRQFVPAPLDDLAGLLTTADLFANPFRPGGGDIALAAIEAGAVVLTRDLGDTAGFVPEAHRAGDADAYFDRLEELAEDASLRQACAAEQRALAGRRLDQAKFAAELKDLVALAYKRYRARLPATLEEILALRPPGVGSLRGRA